MANLETQLTDLQNRLLDALADDDWKPAWLHWSDVFVLKQAIEELTHNRDRLQKITQIAMGMPRE